MTLALSLNTFTSMKNILIFGAGKIGRAFIGQIFGKAGYEIIFVDAMKEIIDLLNTRGEYHVEIRDRNTETITVQKVRGILACETRRISEEIAKTDLIVSSVGMQALPLIAPVIAEGIKLKYRDNPGASTDIILAENLRDASKYFANQLALHLPEKFPLLQHTGLIETSIGKMVPLMTEEELASDPLRVYSETYNTLILDGKGFKNAIPDIKEIAPKENIKAWVDRKLFIHNMGHALAAYFGYSRQAHLKYIHEVLADKETERLTREAMNESGEVLRSIYPHEFSKKEITDHIEDLIQRFQNKLLGDTVYRVGTDLIRKLGKSDRIETPIRYAIQNQLPYTHILAGYKAAMQFNAKNNNWANPNDNYVTEMYREKGLAYVMREISGLDPEIGQEKGIEIPNEI